MTDVIELITGNYQLMLPIPPLDLMALIWFLLCWIGYALVANHQKLTQPNLQQATDAYREDWMLHVLERDNRIADAHLMGSLMGSVSFFASTAILIIGSLVATLGATEQAIAMSAKLPFVAPISPEAWALKVILLLVIFVYAFFKLTWSLRQFNYCCILIGAAPLKPTDQEKGYAYAGRAARLNALAGDNFNQGLRGYYFGLAALTWFINPWLFMAVSAWVVAITNRREFASDTLKTLNRPEEVIASA